MPYADPDQQRRYHLSYYHRRRIKFIQKFGGVCQACGYNEYPEILEWAHKKNKPKRSTVTELMRMSEEVILTEIEQCYLLCPTCHKLYDYGFLEGF